MMERYAVRDGSESNHCCFEATVVDTWSQSFVDAEGKTFYEVVCECFTEAAAEKVCDALNATEEHRKLRGDLKAAGEEVERLRAEVCALRDDARRWRWLERNASLGFHGPPAWGAVIRLPVFVAADDTISALVDRAISESVETWMEGDRHQRTKERSGE